MKTKNKNTESIMFKTSEELKKEIIKIAEKRGTQMSSIIRLAIIKYIASQRENK